MGSGSYSTVSRSARAETMGYATKSLHQTFTKRSIDNAMDPKDVQIRESRDSEEHPNSVAIVLALDLTGSMGNVPHTLVKTGLPHIMDGIIQKGQPDPQLLFVGVGDHECDDAPLQVGQFESSDELLDKWLTDIYLEGGGGGNNGESYLLAWYFAGHRTSIDCFEKRKQKGFLFTIGDEPTLKTLPARDLKDIMGNGQYQDFSASELLDKARESYNVYHIHTRETWNGKKQEIIDGWKQLMGDNLIEVQDSSEIAGIVADIVAEHTNGSQTQEAEVTSEVVSSNDNDELVAGML